MTNLFGVVRCVNVLSTAGMIFLDVVLFNFIYSQERFGETYCFQFLDNKSLLPP